MAIALTYEKLPKNINQRLYKIKNFVQSDLCFFIGLIIVFFSGVVYVALGESIVVDPHDQLDGELFTYILHAKHLDESIYFELMNGLPSTGMQMASPGFLPLYIAFSPATAFALSTFFVMLVAYCGLFALLRSFLVRSWIAAIVAFLFAFLPFYPVYGLSIMGIPALLWLVRRCWCKKEKSRAIFLWVGTIAFSLFSSPVLSGFAVTGLFLLILVFTFFVHRERLFFFKSLLVACVLLLIGYLLTNIDLISQVLWGAGYVSHKSEYVLSSDNLSILDAVLFLFDGQQHAISNQCFIVPFASIGFIASVVLLFKKKDLTAELHSLIFLIISICAIAVFIAIFYEVFHSDVGVMFRDILPGSLKAFQFDRLYWLYPTVWYVLLGICSEFLIRLTTKSRIAKSLIISIFLGICLLTIGKSLATNSIAASVADKIDPNIAFMDDRYTWSEFFGDSIFSEIKEYIYETTNQTPIETSVVSVGVYPSIALYNGFKCLDGYSNNYPLNYKHEFKKIINEELEKSPDLDSYFNGWGNRCYIFSHELGKRYLIESDQNTEINDLSINVNQLKEMGCNYIFSAVKINNAEQIGLHLEKCFSNSQSCYSIYLYCI